ncbi:uncharacterized protein LOC124209729 [Daphnia pulex]|uniref:uncharacterized protein LOC124209729 n=1 Tax=Daphnia pulex TaxID=6669 RepID=UPI001EDD25F9|nr:uncharacterized protein LOC124209729 [Daphnia pulex]
MAGVFSRFLVTLLLSVEFSAQQQSFLPGNSTAELTQLSTKQMISKTSLSPELFQHQIKDRKSYKSNQKEPNKFSELTKKMKKWLKTKDEKVNVEHLVVVHGIPTPVVDRTFPINGTIPEDGCSSTSVRFDDGNCYPLMGRKPCGDPTRYLIVDPHTFKGRCVSRPCGRDRVLVKRTGLCHDINDRSECEGGRRLFYSPYGEPVCDCPVGEYPFPNPRSDCVGLFTQGPCPYGQVVAISPDGSLKCMTSKCPSIYDGDEYFWKQKPLVPTNDGKCYELGSTGRCSKYDDIAPLLLGLDILKNELTCVDINDPSSPYFFSQEENDLLDSLYETFYQDYNFFQIYLVHQILEHENELKYGKKKKKAPKGTYESRLSGPKWNSSAGKGSPVISCGTGSGQGKCNHFQTWESRNFNPKQPIKFKEENNNGCLGGGVPNKQNGSCQAKFRE